MDPRSLPITQRIELLVKALDGAEKTNRALATCADGDAMVDILLGAGQAGFGLTRRDLTETPRFAIGSGSRTMILCSRLAMPSLDARGRSPAPVNRMRQEPWRRRFFGLF